jgi:DNA polymerase-1
MKSDLIIIDTLSGLHEVQNYVNTYDIIAFDTETTGLTKRHEIIGFSICADEGKAYYIILAKWDKTLQVLEYLPYLKEVKILIESLKGKSLVMHNGLYDCMMSEAYFKISLIDSLHTDTMVLAHLLNENRRIALKELAKEYFGEDSTKEAELMKASVIENGGQWNNDNKEMYKADYRLLAKYGAQDALLTYRLFLKLVPELYDQGLNKFFYEDESMPLLRTATYDLNTTGLQVDTNALITLKKTLEAECAEDKAFIFQEIAPHIKDKYPGTNKKNTFNIGASQQLAWLLFGQLNLEFSYLTDGGKKACKSMNIKPPYTFTAKRNFIALCQNNKDAIQQPEVLINGKKVRAKKFKDPWAYIAVDKETLTKLSSKYKWIERLLSYQRKLKILNTYVKGIEDKIQYGVINPSFNQCGTTSGRYSSSKPNFQNLPRDEKRVKQFIVTRPGRVFVGADMSQLEPRIFAYYSKDEKLLEAFKGKDDFYSVIGIETFEILDSKPTKEDFGVKYKGLRDVSKVIALATTYGSTAYQLAPTIKKTVDQTQEVIDNYFEKFPGVAEMMLEAHRLAKKDGQVINYFGRPRRMPDAKIINKLYGDVPHGELPYEARNLLNLSVNHRIQSTAASIMNRAMIRLSSNVKELGLSAKMVVQVHDSIVMECDSQDAETISLLLQDALENTNKLEGIDFEAIPRIGLNLSEV